MTAAAAPNETFAMKTIPIGQEHIEVRQLNIGQIAKIMALWTDVLTRYGEGADPLALLAGGAEKLIDAVAIATNRDAVWVGQLTPATFKRLLLAVGEMNQDLANHLLPQLRAVAATGGVTIPETVSFNGAGASAKAAPQA